MRALADRLVAELAVSARLTGSADLMSAVAHVLPVEVIAELLGLPEELRPPAARLVDRDRRDVRARPRRRRGAPGRRRRPRSSSTPCAS